jgi:hypothetical protein
MGDFDGCGFRSIWLPRWARQSLYEQSSFGEGASERLEFARQFAFSCNASLHSARYGINGREARNEQAPQRLSATVSVRRQLRIHHGRIRRCLNSGRNATAGFEFLKSDGLRGRVIADQSIKDVT